MSETQLDIAWEEGSGEQRDKEPTEELSLAAALAAALVEYRRYTEPKNKASSQASASAGWRTVARVEQLARSSQRGLRG